MADTRNGRCKCLRQLRRTFAISLQQVESDALR
jgi:hypothetical protein